MSACPQLFPDNVYLALVLHAISAVHKISGMFCSVKYSVHSVQKHVLLLVKSLVSTPYLYLNSIAFTP